MSITFQGEKLASCLEEMKAALLNQHWEELAINKDKVPLDPDYETYFAAEQAGELFLITIRHDEVLIGYFIGFIKNELHYKTCLTCTMDILYLKPEYRNSGIGVKFFNYLERNLKELGVARWYVGSKMHKDISHLFEKLGFNIVEVYYSKYIGE